MTTADRLATALKEQSKHGAANQRILDWDHKQHLPVAAGWHGEVRGGAGGAGGTARRRGDGLLPKYHWCTKWVRFMLMKSKECPGDLARKCKVPGTFFTSTNPAPRRPLPGSARGPPDEGRGRAR